MRVLLVKAFHTFDSGGAFLPRGHDLARSGSDESARRGGGHDTGFHAGLGRISGFARQSAHATHDCDLYRGL